MILPVIMTQIIVAQVMALVPHATQLAIQLQVLAARATPPEVVAPTAATPQVVALPDSRIQLAALAMKPQVAVAERPANKKEAGNSGIKNKGCIIYTLCN